MTGVAWSHTKNAINLGLAALDSPHNPRIATPGIVSISVSILACFFMLLPNVLTQAFLAITVVYEVAPEKSFAPRGPRIK